MLVDRADRDIGAPGNVLPGGGEYSLLRVQGERRLENAPAGFFRGGVAACHAVAARGHRRAEYWMKRLSN